MQYNICKFLYTRVQFTDLPPLPFLPPPPPRFARTTTRGIFSICVAAAATPGSAAAATTTSAKRSNNWRVFNGSIYILLYRCGKFTYFIFIPTRVQEHTRAHANTYRYTYTTIYILYCEYEGAFLSLTPSSPNSGLTIYLVTRANRCACPVLFMVTLYIYIDTIFGERKNVGDRSACMVYLWGLIWADISLGVYEKKKKKSFFSRAICQKKCYWSGALNGLLRLPTINYEHGWKDFINFISYAHNVVEHVE